MSVNTLSADQLADALNLRDLTDPAAGEHSIQHVVTAIENALATAWRIPVWRDPGPRVVRIADHYDRLRYERDAITRDSRYSRYVDGERMLRAHTTAHLPRLLARLAAGDCSACRAGDGAGPAEVLLSVPGICYRRDAIDRTHVGEPHQMDLWRIRVGGPALTEDDLTAMVDLVVGAVLPATAWHAPSSPHPYTLAGREIYAGGVEVGECGLAHPDILRAAGLPAGSTGLAMGLGLDRLTMLVKAVPDIRLLRATAPRIAGQMRDLTQYRPVSSMPATHRDLSLAVAADLDAELLGDQVRELLGPEASVVEEVRVLGETGCDDLPESARRRMGVRAGQKNVLLRLVLRDLTRTLTSAQANELRDRIYADLHEGGAHEWARPTF